ncbi:hypothetical protein [Staphylococcus auricularis]|uniref:hypothetical protein n=1 Tax=Staphylococcus auricularis TaxID=29379 RepID=UPI001F2910C3|nr:hypothetical protein [Staphylococcus auricularis]MCE5038832.1 hypothetical protein [Staphylococcus auricularis]
MENEGDVWLMHKTYHIVQCILLVIVTIVFVTSIFGLDETTKVIVNFGAFVLILVLGAVAFVLGQLHERKK